MSAGRVGPQKAYALSLCFAATLAGAGPCGGHTPRCRDDITEAMGYTVRDAWVAGRWVPPALNVRVKEIVRVGQRFSPAVLAPAQSEVDREIRTRENSEIELATLGVVAVEKVESCVMDVSDPEHPKQVDIVIRPYYLRIDLYNTGANLLPIPHTNEFTFFDRVPRALLLLSPKPEALYRRRSGLSPAVQTSIDLLDPGDPGAASRRQRPGGLFLGLGARRSVDQPFYDLAASLALERRTLQGGPRRAWSLGARYAGTLAPLAAAKVRTQALQLGGSLQLRPRTRLVDSLDLALDLRRSDHRYEVRREAMLLEKNETGLQARVISDGRADGGLMRLGFWADGSYPDGSHSYQRLAGILGYAREFGSGHETIGIEVLAGGGQTWGSVPEYARFYGGNPAQNFLYEPMDSPTLRTFPIGPILRSAGEAASGARLRDGGVRGGRSYWHVNLNLAVPIRGGSRPLIPDVEAGRTSLRKILKSRASLATPFILEGLIKEGMPNNAETEAKAEEIVNRDIRPGLEYLADRANLYALKLLLLADVAGLDVPGAVGNTTRLSLGGGLQLTVVTARFEVGYVYAVRRARSDPSGSLFLRLVFQNLF